MSYWQRSSLGNKRIMRWPKRLYWTKHELLPLLLITLLALLIMALTVWLGFSYVD